MKELRLSSQYNYIETFDLFDNNITNNNQGSSSFNGQKSFKVQSENFKDFTQLVLHNNLFLEFLTGQKAFSDFESNLFNSKMNFLKVTLRKTKIFLFMEVILHNIFIKWQINKMLHIIKVTDFTLFLSYVIFEKLFSQMSVSKIIISNY
uniref:hypothetical protein n=1 Tax=Hydropuntia eucheumatoides TaxID=172970 RepID=UPI002E7946B7|nr:hypothetical protein V2418_mgp01 [Gracilaria eucheumatoides]WPS66080.1 hypothetical protein [Gracilaria eucheumatoides]